MSPTPNKDLFKEQEQAERARIIATLREQCRKAEEKGNFNSAHHMTLAAYLKAELAAAAPQKARTGESEVINNGE